jgi:hypothetical protein
LYVPAPFEKEGFALGDAMPDIVEINGMKCNCEEALFPHRRDD